MEHDFAKGIPLNGGTCEIQFVDAEDVECFDGPDACPAFAIHGNEIIEAWRKSDGLNGVCMAALDNDSNGTDESTRCRNKALR